MKVRCATKSHDKTGEAWGTFHKIGFWDFDFHLRMMPVYDVTYFRRISPYPGCGAGRSQCESLTADRAP